MAVKKRQLKGRQRKEKSHEKRMTENSEDEWEPLVGKNTLPSSSTAGTSPVLHRAGSRRRQ